jgi:hypothetical protein
MDTPVTRATLAFYRASLTRCFDWWEGGGIDIDSCHDRERP